jgi:predicted lipoprotein with Yx(FWY)xxD motif
MVRLRTPHALRLTVTAAAAALAVVSTAAVGATASAVPTGAYGPTAAVSVPTATVAEHKGALGTYLVGAGGRAIYLWKADPLNVSVCTDACATFWPPVTGTPTAGAGLSQSAFGSITRTDGTTQVTYHGHALYYFSFDKTSKTTAGQGSNGFGARWWLVTPSGKAITEPLVNVATHKSALGTYLIGKAGKAIYLWAADPANKSVCTAKCPTFWPPVIGIPTAGAGLSQSLFGWIKRSDGKLQTTYNGHPLYYFLFDKTSKTTAGEGSNGFGARWWLVKPSGKALTAPLVNIAVRAGSLGTYLIGKGGRAIYLWEADSKNESACTGTCAKFWPPVTGIPTAETGVTATALGSITRSDGKTQVTYDGHPLYYFAGDKTSKTTAGQGSDAFDATWWLVMPTGVALTS